MTHDDAEDIKRYFNVVSEGLRSEIRLVAEAHAALDLKIDGVREELNEFRGNVRSETRLLAEGQQAQGKEMAGFRQEMAGFRQEMTSFRQEMAGFRQEVADYHREVQGEFRDVRTLTRLYDTRLERIEGQHS